MVFIRGRNAQLNIASPKPSVQIRRPVPFADSSPRPSSTQVKGRTIQFEKIERFHVKNLNLQRALIGQ